MTDTMTLAYVAIGAQGVLNANPFSRPALNRGLDFIGEIIKYAPDLDIAVAGREDDIGGCFAYEVAEPFGQWAAYQLLEEQEALDPVAVKAKIKELTKGILLEN